MSSRHSTPATQLGNLSIGGSSSSPSSASDMPPVTRAARKRPAENRTASSGDAGSSSRAQASSSRTQATRSTARQSARRSGRDAPGGSRTERTSGNDGDDPEESDPEDLSNVGQTMGEIWAIFEPNQRTPSEFARVDATSVDLAGYYRRALNITVQSLPPRGQEQLRQAFPPGTIANQLGLNMWQRFLTVQDGFRRHVDGKTAEHDVPETEKALSELSVATHGIYHRYVDHLSEPSRQRLVDLLVDILGYIVHWDHNIPPPPAGFVSEGDNNLYRRWMSEQGSDGTRGKFMEELGRVEVGHLEQHKVQLEELYNTIRDKMNRDGDGDTNPIATLGRLRLILRNNLNVNV